MSKEREVKCELPTDEEIQAIRNKGNIPTMKGITQIQTPEMKRVSDAVAKHVEEFKKDNELMSDIDRKQRERIQLMKNYKDTFFLISFQVSQLKMMDAYVQMILDLIEKNKKDAGEEYIEPSPDYPKYKWLGMDVSLNYLQSRYKLDHNTYVTNFMELNKFKQDLLKTGLTDEELDKHLNEGTFAK
jgi:hypothetical protein